MVRTGRLEISGSIPKQMEKISFSLQRPNRTWDQLSPLILLFSYDFINSVYCRVRLWQIVNRYHQIYLQLPGRKCDARLSPASNAGTPEILQLYLHNQSTAYCTSV